MSGYEGFIMTTRKTAAKHNPITGSRLLRDYDLLILSILHTRNLNVIYWGEKYD